MFQRLSVGGDVIVALDGKEVANQLDVSILLNHKKPGEVVSVTYYRGGKKLETNVTLGERQD
jgi:serine protease Do